MAASGLCLCRCRFGLSLGEDGEALSSEASPKKLCSSELRNGQHLIQARQKARDTRRLRSKEGTKCALAYRLLE